jgi:DNA replication and repair protein RecF
LSFKYDKELYATLDIWDKQLVEYGNKIIQRREEFIKELDNIIHEIHGNLSGGKESVTLRYEPNTTTESFAIDLQRNKEKDLKLKTTSVGPHRDDMGFYISDIDIRKFGSQGQQRTAALSLKLSEIEFVKNIIHDTPVLLLDDVMSELDSHRQNQLLNSLQGLQTIVTCTGLDEFIENRIHMNRIYKIVSGTASLYEESN